MTRHDRLDGSHSTVAEVSLEPGAQPVLRYPAALAQEVLARFGQHLHALPVGLSASIVLDAGPPPHVEVLARHDGPAGDLMAWVDEWQCWADPDEETARPATDVEVLVPDDRSKTSAVFVATATLRTLDDDVIAVIVDGVLGPDPVGEQVEVGRLAGPRRPDATGGAPVAAGLVMRVTVTASTEAEVPRVEQRLVALEAVLRANGVVGHGNGGGLVTRRVTSGSPRRGPLR